MPYVKVRIAGTLTRVQKKQIATEITDTLERAQTQVLHLHYLRRGGRRKLGSRRT